MSAEHGATRSAVWRGALWITCIALIATSLALTLQYLQTTQTMTARREAAVDDEMSGLVERYRSGGLAGVSQAIQQQLNVPRIHEFFYLLAWPDRTVVTGNLVDWPSQIGSSGFYRFETSVTNTRGDSSKRWVEARVVTLDGGFRLLVGDFADDQAALRERYRSSLLWTLAATGAIGLLLGWWYSRRGLTFVEEVSTIGQRFLGGAMSERLPVTERADEYDRLAETINRTFEEVERLVGSLRAATDGMAHDLKTPLTRIRVRLELVELSGAPEVELREVIAKTRADLDALLGLINDMLSLARTEATGSASFVPTSLDEIVAEALELYQPLAEDKGITLVSDVAPVIVSGSRSLLGHMVANLLDNAVKYTPAAGTISVALTAGATEAILVVSDTGPGIAEERHRDVLERFRRLDESRSTIGSGLGLSIVDAVARVHGAVLTMFNAQPGLRVEIRIPTPSRSDDQIGDR